jgi:hypothetical protein
MAIDVTCPGCHTRFQVSEKFAGKSGPCPKCKKTIKVPDLKDKVVIHAPEVSGPTDSKGKAVLQPIFREEVRLQTPQIVAIAGSVVGVMAISLVMRLQFPGGHVPLLVPILGGILLGPPLAFAGYTFLRDDELAPFRGQEVLVRTVACGLVYALIWGIYWLVFAYFNNWKPLSHPPDWQLMAAVLPVMVGLGALTAQSALEFELGMGALHYSMYLAATVILRLLMNVDPRWTI